MKDMLDDVSSGLIELIKTDQTKAKKVFKKFKIPFTKDIEKLDLWLMDNCDISGLQSINKVL